MPIIKSKIQQVPYEAYCGDEQRKEIRLARGTSVFVANEMSLLRKGMGESQILHKARPAAQSLGRVVGTTCSISAWPSSRLCTKKT